MPLAAALWVFSVPYRALCFRRRRLWRLLLFLLLFLNLAESIPKNDLDDLDEMASETDEFSPPAYSLQPQDAYVIRNRPANLTCKATHALKVSFKCQGISEVMPKAVETFFVDPMTGAPKVEAVLSLPRHLVEKSTDEQGVRCHCLAWSSRGQTTSDSAKVKIAYFRRHFIESPYSRSVGYHSEVELRCIPPEGRPQPKTSWLKNNIPVDLNVHKNYRISSEGSLLILFAEGDDSANFTCLAENVVGKRLSDTAAIRVFVDGGWSSWSAWTNCNAKCGRGYQRRTRTCTKPEPANGGAACQGMAMQKTDCSTPCPAVNGKWSSWGEWSICGLDCHHYRKRACDSPRPRNRGRYCAGKDLVSTNCTGGMCQEFHSIHRGKPSDQALEVALKQDITLIVVLGVVVPLILVLFVIVFRKYNRKRHRDGPLYEVAFDYPLSFCSTKKNKKPIDCSDRTHSIGVGTPAPTVQLCYDPSCTKPPSTMNSNNSGHSHQKPLTFLSLGGSSVYAEDAYNVVLKDKRSSLMRSSATLASEHHYDVPLIRSPSRSPLPEETSHLLAPPHPHTPLAPHFPHTRATPTTDSGFGGPGGNDWKGESLGSSLEKPFRSISPSSFSENNSDSLHRLSSGTGSDPSDKEGSCLPSELSELCFEAAAWGSIGPSGGRLSIPECGVSLTIPEGALPPESPRRNLYITVITSSEVELLDSSQTLLSPVVCVGPPDVVVKKPFVISFEHSGSLQHAAWQLHLMGCPSVPQKGSCDVVPPWTKLVTLGEERIDTPFYAQLDGSQIHLMTECFQQYALVGQSADQKAAVKQLRIIVTAPPPSSSEELNIALHLIQDTAASLACVSHKEKSKGSCLLDKPKSFLLHDWGTNLSVSLDEVHSGWNLKPGLHRQELPFNSVWGSTEGVLTTTFTFERQDGVPSSPLSCRVMVQQRSSTTHRQIIRVNTDFPYAPVTGLSLTHPTFRDPSVTWNSGSYSLVSVSPELEAFRIPQRVKGEISRCLDPPNSRGNDWRMLAARLNADRYLNYFASRSSPTEHILDLWEARNREKNALTDLINVFRVMGRPDVAHILETHPAGKGSWI